MTEVRNSLNFVNTSLFKTWYFPFAKPSLLTRKSFLYARLIASLFSQIVPARETAPKKTAFNLRRYKVLNSYVKLRNFTRIFL